MLCVEFRNTFWEILYYFFLALSHVARSRCVRQCQCFLTLSRETASQYLLRKPMSLFYDDVSWGTLILSSETISITAFCCSLVMNPHNIFLDNITIVFWFCLWRTIKISSETFCSVVFWLCLLRHIFSETLCSIALRPSLLMQLHNIL
jgi:hypothetical protein